MFKLIKNISDTEIQVGRRNYKLIDREKSRYVVSLLYLDYPTTQAQNFQVLIEEAVDSEHAIGKAIEKVESEYDMKDFGLKSKLVTFVD